MFRVIQIMPIPTEFAIIGGSYAGIFAAKTILVRIKASFKCSLS